MSTTNAELAQLRIEREARNNNNNVQQDNVVSTPDIIEILSDDEETDAQSKTKTIGIKRSRSSSSTSSSTSSTTTSYLEDAMLARQLQDEEQMQHDQEYAKKLMNEQTFSHTSTTRQGLGNTTPSHEIVNLNLDLKVFEIVQMKPYPVIVLRNAKSDNGNKLEHFGEHLVREADEKENKTDQRSIANRAKRMKRGHFSSKGHTSMCGAAEKQRGARDNYQIILDNQRHHRDKTSGKKEVQDQWRNSVVAPVLLRVQEILRNGNHQFKKGDTMNIFFDTQQRNTERQSGSNQRSLLHTDDGDFGNVRVLRYSASSKNVDPEGGKHSPLHRHRDHSHSGLVVLVSLRLSCEFFCGQSDGNNDTVGRPKKGATPQEMAVGGQMLTLNHGDILIFDASRTANGSGLVHGVDRIIPNQSSGFKERISIQWRQTLADRYRQMQFAWTMTNIADFETDQFKRMFEVVGITPRTSNMLDQDRIQHCNYLSHEISSKVNADAQRLVLFDAVSSICAIEENWDKYLSKRVGKCFKSSRYAFGTTWHIGKGGHTSICDIADSVFTGWVYAPTTPNAKNRDAKIEIPILKRQAHY